MTIPSTPGKSVTFHQFDPEYLLEYSLEKVQIELKKIGEEIAIAESPELMGQLIHRHQEGREIARALIETIRTLKRNKT